MLIMPPVRADSVPPFPWGSGEGAGGRRGGEAPLLLGVVQTPAAMTLLPRRKGKEEGSANTFLSEDATLSSLR